MAFEYHWYRKEANFGPVIETEVDGGTHFTIESILMFEGKFVALRRPQAIPHHEIPQRVGKPLLYSTSQFFMNYFGINSVDELPKLKDIEQSTENVIGSPSEN